MTAQELVDALNALDIHNLSAALRPSDGKITVEISRNVYVGSSPVSVREVLRELAYEAEDLAHDIELAMDDTS